MNVGSVNVNSNSNISGTSALSKAQYEKENGEIEAFQDMLTQTEDDAKLKEACDQFEEYFINLMFKEMRKTVNEDDSENSMFKKGQAESMTEDYLYQAYSSNMTAAGGIGLSDAMYNQMKIQNEAREETEKILSEGLDSSEIQESEEIQENS